MTGRNLGIAIDLSPTSRYALRWALDHFCRDGDHVIVLVVRKKEGGDSALFEKAGTPLIPMHDNDEHVLDKYGLKPDHFVLVDLTVELWLQFAVNGKIYYGDAREKIIEAVGELKLDLLVLGSRGLGTVKRALLGSVSNYVINNAPCPVTVVKLPESQSHS